MKCNKNKEDCDSNRKLLWFFAFAALILLLFLGLSITRNSPLEKYAGTKLCNELGLDFKDYSNSNGNVLCAKKPIKKENISGDIIGEVTEGEIKINIQIE